MCFFDKKKKAFALKDTYDDKIEFYLPRELLEVRKSQNLKEVFKNLKWIDSDSFYVRNAEGIEKTVKINKSSLIELGYNWRNIPTKSHNSVFDSFFNILENYKSCYFMNINQRNDEELIKQVFEVDS